ncbi:TonB-dependent receptor plug domain-containing protein [Azonexus sp. IMCC34842]|uniref:TonB-dependent receptor plug domain-containing protein n=1 Tax=Azonexus sp. IMCC34842 TaxID=3420950 RepID=UPI003D0E274F
MSRLISEKQAIEHGHKFALRLLPALLAAAFSMQSAADTTASKTGSAAAESNVFTLGQITVSAKREDETPLGTATLDREQIWDFSRDALPEALNIIPGVTTTAGSGSRNESLISIRGFDRWQVPLFMDGIRLYLPADNRIDFDRFLTPDLSEIQVSKGYVSVLNGPDGMGGAINLVTRKPVKPFEGEARASASFGNDGKYSGNTEYVNVGGRQESYYLQASVEQRDMDHWRVSNDFKPTVAENGGDRDNTSKKDWRVNLKAGFTPNATDEYSLNFVKQEGEKHGIGAVTGTSTISTWDWPTWDTSSLYWLSHTQLTDKTYLKTRAYYNTFENTLVAYTNVSLNTQNFVSYYDDNAKGFSVEVGTDYFAQQTLKAALHYRRDEHKEWQYTRAATTTTPANFTEPAQKTVEDTVSVALEDTWHITSKFDLVGGISRDARYSKQAEEFASPGGSIPSRLFNQPISDSYATNYQAAGIYRYSNTGKAHLSVSDRTRFPTMFERFSSRFGGAISNPWIKPERATNIELGIADVLMPGIRGEAAIFHSEVKDAIQSVPIVYNGTTYSQSQNIGEATFKGVELGLTAAVSSSLEVGGNYSYIDTQLNNPNDSTACLTTTPQHKAFIYAKWRPISGLTVIPALEHASDRWSSKAVGTGYVKTGAYDLLSLKLEYLLMRDWSVSLTGRNLTDKNYQLVDGYPQEGRNFVLATRFQF